MCCFTGKVEHVSSTNIFARAAEKGRQLLAYGMTVSVAEPVAMVLPLPVPKGSPDNALRWIDLAGYPELFRDLNQLFMPPPTKSARGLSKSAGLSKGALEVVTVGDFEASFVPAVKDFSRLDARFRLADAVWKSLPQYADWGFAVFKLKAGNQAVHPMAFEFPTRVPQQLFFPTVHVHDGAVRKTAVFDHTLYLQRADGEPKLDPKTWAESSADAQRHVNVDKAQGLVLGGEHVYRRVIRGEQKNDDTAA
jgi:hypothetical protein